MSALYKPPTVSLRRGFHHRARSTPVSARHPPPPGCADRVFVSDASGRLPQGTASLARAPHGGAQLPRKPFVESPADYFYLRAELAEARTRPLRTSSL